VGEEDVYDAAMPAGDELSAARRRSILSDDGDDARRKCSAHRSLTRVVTLLFPF